MAPWYFIAAMVFATLALYLCYLKWRDRDR